MEDPIAPVSRCRSRHLWILLLIVAVVHVPALFAPFFLDDFVYLDQVSEFTWPKALQLFSSPTLDRSASGVWWTPPGTLPFYRPVGQLFFAADRCLWGLRPFGYHLTNTALHMVCVLLAWRLAMRLFRVPAYALAAAVVFALHPVHVEAVTWISGRFDLLVCACALACVLSYLKWCDGEARRWAWAACSVFWFAVALGCKETALVVPAMLAGVEVLCGAGPARRFRPLRIAAAAFAIVALLYVVGRILLFGGLFGRLPPPYGLDASSPLVAMKNIAWNSAQYLFDMALFIHVEPTHLSPFWHEHPLLFGTALTIAVLLLAGVAIAGRSRALLVGLTWLVVFTAPSLLSMPGERNVYLASVGLALVVAAGFRGLQTHRAGSPEPETPPRLTPRLRRISCAVVGLWLVICIAKQTLMGVLAVSGEKAYRDLLAVLPDPPRNARIYVVHQNPLNAVGFTQAIRLHYGRSDLSGCALSLSPSLGATSRDEVSAIGPDSLQIARQDGAFFSSFFERFLLFAEPASGLVGACRLSGLELLDPPTSFESLHVLKLRLPGPIHAPSIQVFYWDNQRVSGRLDLLRLGSLTELRSSKPAFSATTLPQ